MSNPNTKIPQFYCINLENRPDRKNHMIERFEKQDLLSNLTFIKAISKDCSLIDYYDNKQTRGVTGCFASHLKAIRTFLESTEESAIICEDDILLVDNFCHRYQKIIENVPKDTSLFLLLFMPVVDWDKFSWSGITPGKRNLLNNIKDVLGTYAYWISRDHAKMVLKKYDRPDFGTNDKVGDEKTSELITRNSQGLLAYPPLVLEECYKSDLRSDYTVENSHALFFGQWQYKRYSKGIDISFSHLSTKTDDKIWRAILARSQQLGDNERGIKYLFNLYQETITGTTKMPISEIESFLYLYYVSAFYAKREFAVEIAKQYMSFVDKNSEFKQIFLSKKDYVLNNFKYVNIKYTD